ncbi:hypothetical protein F0562_035569 [Nyssa sinensis]|uniref:Peptidase A1 domain-containing protein n=1 Tax=Nyssa sinensis TaxID=561372 RepID=A0A5J5AC90_9ASTE|nr:hypothetical protein F0562_035569 [Nyssa sinensis]
MGHFLCFLTIIISHLSIGSLVEAKIGGFSIDLVHRDSQLSPFYNHSSTPSDLATHDAFRSIARVNQFHSSSIEENKIESIIIPNGGSYLMKFSLGTPPVEIFASADTGSDLIWIQCEPCNQDKCFPQDRPLFDPMKSSTYIELPCDSKPCQALQSSQCDNTKNQCQYSIGYGDGSYTNGVLTTDTFTFDSAGGQAAAFPNSVFGCGYDNGGTFNSRESGLVGLGGGPLSLVSQLATEIDQKFAYCLLPRTVNSASKLKFGTDAVLSGQGVVSTPLISRGSGTFYYLTLEAVSVGDKRIENRMDPNNEGNIIIDSGTTLNLLEPNFYNDIVAAIREAISTLNPVQDPQGNYDLCYDKNSLSMAPETAIVYHFTGADVTLKRLNTFRELNTVSCLAMLPSTRLSVYGNVAQVNFQVLYDLKMKQVSFAPADCVVSTPLSGSDTFYYLTLEAVSVGDKRIENPSTTSNSEGNIIIDSGTTLNLLEPNFYNDIKAAITEAINLNPVQDPQGHFDLCYNKNSFSTAPELKVIFHFTGADVTLKTLNTFEELDYITCLTIFPTENSAIFGNRAQINFQVAYDLARKQVSFAPADCTQY